MKIRVASSVVVFSIGFFGLLTVPAVTFPTWAATDLSPQLIQVAQGANKYLVIEIQKALLRVGYDPGPPDGSVTERTKGAIEAFQINSGQPVDGVPSRALFESILAYEAAGGRATELARPIPEPQPQPVPQPEPQPVVVNSGDLPQQDPTLSPYLIREIQESLALAGYDPGPVSGTIDARTVSAIRTFQRDNGLRQDGLASKRLYEQIIGQRQAGGSSQSTVAGSNYAKPKSQTAATPTADRNLVWQVQQGLADLGYDPGPVDGAMGNRTRGAILRFQSNAGLAPDGQASQSLLAAITATKAARQAPADSQTSQVAVATQTQTQSQPQAATQSQTTALAQQPSQPVVSQPQAVQPAAPAAPVTPSAPAGEDLPWLNAESAPHAAQEQAQLQKLQAQQAQQQAHLQAQSQGHSTYQPTQQPLLQHYPQLNTQTGVSNELPWLQQGATGVQQPGLAQPGLVQPGLTQPGLAQPGLAQGSIAGVLPGATATNPESLPWLQQGATAPQVGVPQVGVPQVGVPQVAVPQAGVAINPLPLPGQPTYQVQGQQATQPFGGHQQAWQTPGARIEGIVTVIDTATLLVSGQTLQLAGTLGYSEPSLVAGLKSYISSQGGRVSCVGERHAGYTCRTAIGFDVAQAAIFNGAARAAPDAPYQYKEAEQRAKAARVGLWY